MSTRTAPTLGALQTIPLEQLRPDRKNIRKDMGDLGQLADSIRELGILDPLQVTAHGTMAGDYQVIDGHRRLQAAKRAGLTELPCIVKDGPDKATRLKTMLATGLTHKTLNAVEEANGIQQMLDLGETIASIARTTGRTQKDLKSKHKLVGLPKEAETAVVAQTMTVEQAIVLQDFADDAEATERLMVAAANGRDWDWAVNNERRNRRLPGFLDEVRAAFEAHKPKALPQGGEWNGKYRNVGDEDRRSAVTYTPGTLEASVQAHAEANHVYKLDENYGVLTWFEAIKASKVEKPKPTPEQLEEAERMRRFTAGLEISHQTEMEHLTAVVGSKNALDAEGQLSVLQAMLNDFVWRDRDLAIRLLGVKHFPDGEYSAETEAIRSAAGKLNIAQLIALYGVLVLSEPALKKPRGWEYLDGHNKDALRWLEIREAAYGRPLDAMEAEVREHYKQSAPEVAASAYDRASEEGADDEDAA